MMISKVIMALLIILPGMMMIAQAASHILTTTAGPMEDDVISNATSIDNTTLGTEEPMETTTLDPGETLETTTLETTTLGTTPLGTSPPLETTTIEAVTVSVTKIGDTPTSTMTDPPTSTESTPETEPPKLPPNLQSLSLVLFNATSRDRTPSSLSYDPSPPRHQNNILSILPLTPGFSSPVTQQAPSSVPEEEEEDESPTLTTSISDSFTMTNNADSMLNLTGELGGSVFLPCTTHHSMERQVSWVRRRDWHILTSGTVAYTKEERFSVHHPEGSTDWTLVIKYIELSDAGTYECQVSTGTGILSRLVDLNVVVPEAAIPGNGEYHIDAGSTITLDCFIHQSLVAPQYIFWYHNSRMINYDRERGGVSVHIDTGPAVRSRLTVKRAMPDDSGNYTCAAANSKPAYTTVYITNGNKIAAIQPRAMAGETRLRSCLSLVTFLLSLQLLHHLQ